MRAYTVVEIDRMRAALINRRAMPRLEQCGNLPNNHPANVALLEQGLAVVSGIQSHTEELLRTYMLAGVEPEELERPIKERREQLEAEFPPGSRWSWQSPPDKAPPMSITIHVIRDDGLIEFIRDGDTSVFWREWEPEFIRKNLKRECP